MTQTIAFELVSPEARLVSEPVVLANIPGAEGVFGVGANHSALVATLQAGVVELYLEGQTVPRKIFIAGGFADVTGESCTVLAEQAVNVNDLNQADLERVLKDLTEDLGLAQEAADKARIERKMGLIKAQLSAVTGKLVF